jgi:hypothetical protein
MSLRLLPPGTAPGQCPAALPAGRRAQRRGTAAATIFITIVLLIFDRVGHRARMSIKPHAATPKTVKKVLQIVQ